MSLGIEQKLTERPVEIPRLETVPFQPEFVRLPKPGKTCLLTGMTRGSLNALILPTQQNNRKPPVRSFVLRQKGAKTGIRLIDWQSLRDYIRAHEDGEFVQEPAGAALRSRSRKQPAKEVAT